MAELKYIPVTFNEGAPLDPSLLMQLQNNVNTAYATSMNLSNKTEQTVYTVKSDCDKVRVDELTGGKTGKVTVTVPGYTKAAIVVATVATVTSDKEQVTVEVRNVQDGSFVIAARSSNTKRAFLDINWHISERQ